MSESFGANHHIAQVKESGHGQNRSEVEHSLDSGSEVVTGNNEGEEESKERNSQGERENGHHPSSPQRQVDVGLCTAAILKSSLDYRLKLSAIAPSTTAGQKERARTKIIVPDNTSS
jgi:hypothetical protein